MNAFLYGLALQWKLDLRSKTLLITCYLVPLLFFVMMGGIFTTILPGAEETLLPAMTVFGARSSACRPPWWKSTAAISERSTRPTGFLCLWGWCSPICPPFSICF